VKRLQLELVVMSIVLSLST